MFAFAAADFDRAQVAARARSTRKEAAVLHDSRRRSDVVERARAACTETVGPFTMDLEALDSYLAWQYIPAPRTIYSGVRALPPGHLATIDLRTGKVRRAPLLAPEVSRRSLKEPRRMGRANSTPLYGTRSRSAS